MKYIIDKYGHKYWFNKNGSLHREDGPAYEKVNGNKKWFLNNICYPEYFIKIIIFLKNNQEDI